MIISRNKGFSLIEVLISLFVLGLGIVGAAGLQLASIRTAQQSSYQSVAVQLANELADKIRSNDVVMRLPDSANPFLKIDYNSLTDTAPATPTLCYTNAANCSASDLANADIYEWMVRLKKELPGGRVVVCRDSSPFDSATKSLTWVCKQDSTAGITVKVGWKSKNPDGSFNVNSSGTIPPSVAITVESYVK